MANINFESKAIKDRMAQNAFILKMHLFIEQYEDSDPDLSKLTEQEKLALASGVIARRLQALLGIE